MAEGGDEVMGGFSELPRELLGIVLEKLQAGRQAGRQVYSSGVQRVLFIALERHPQTPFAPLAGDWGGVEDSRYVRLVCSGWRDSHDTLVTRLTVSGTTTDEGMRLLVRRFPTVVSLEMKGDHAHLCSVTNDGLRELSRLTGLKSLNLSHCSNLTDKGLRAVSSLTGLTSLNLRDCSKVSNKGLQVVSSLTGLTSLNLTWCELVTDEGLRVVSSLTGITSLDLWACSNVTDKGMRTLSRLTRLNSLDISRCDKVTDPGLRVVGSLTGLTSLSIWRCDNVTRAGVEALRRVTASTNLRIQGP